MPTPKPTAGDMFIGWGLLMQKLEVTATHLEKILLLPSFPKPVVDGVKTRSKKWSAREVDTWKAEYPHLIQEAAKTRPRSTRALVLAEWRIEIEERLAEIEKILKGMA